MKKVFAASLCQNGLLGGGLYVDSEKLTYRTGKLTVPPEIRNLAIPYTQIESVFLERLVFFPAVRFLLKDGKEWKFLVFARKSFLHSLQARGVQGGNGQDGFYREGT